MINIPNYQIRTQIYESANSLVYRGIRKKDNQPVILKALKEDYPTSEELTCYRQEYDITRQLSEVDGIVKAYELEKYQNTLVIILEDFGGESLKNVLNPPQPPFAKVGSELSPPQPPFAKVGSENKVEVPHFFKGGLGGISDFLSFAIQITDILGQIHRQNIIHKDINPSNIILNSNTGVLKIIDFGIATQFKKQHLRLTNPEVLEGTLAYMSPEQTGRMNRALDYRTDFYSLGATFYELLTSQVPFESTDAMELVHCHIAKTPIPVCEVNPNIPPIISDIVMKLMAKNAEDRYQSAWGIKADLEKCLENLRGFQNLEGFSFELAQHDFSEHFQIPEKLYGRESEINTLLSGFKQVASGKAEIMLVAGYSGIGKSVLVKEIYKSLSEKQGHFISGKFDQFQRNIPYSAIVNAFKELVQQLLTENEQQLSVWKEKLLSALGPNGQVIIDVIPEIEWIIGKQPPVPLLGATESQNRFNLVFQNFMRVFCQPEHPLVIFLDDLQWVDSATLKLLELVMTDQDNTALFLIGAYRDNEVDSTHPLMTTLDKLHEENVAVNQITLKPLSFEDVNQLIADSLHHNLETVSELTDLVMRKTGGNPFFVNQFLHTLYEEELLTFIPPKSPLTPLYESGEQTEIPPFGKGGLGGISGWTWDIDQIKALNITDNVVDLMIGKLKKLPQSAQQILRLAACIGNRFDLDTLSVICEKSTTETFQDILPVLTEGFILPSSSLELSDKEIQSSTPLIRHFRFLHDRVQQAAYALIEEEQKQAVHLQIGRLLLQNTPVVALEEKVFDIVGQFNHSIGLLNNQVERLKVAKLNLMAGQKAKMATAYGAALNYLSVGRECLTDSTWETNYPLTFALYKECYECAYLNIQFEQAEELFNLIINHVENTLHKAEVYAIYIRQISMQGKYAEAIQIGKAILNELGLELPPDDELPVKIRKEITQVKNNLENRDFQAILDMPLIDAPEKKAILGILMDLCSPAYFHNLDLFRYIMTRTTNIGLTEGHFPGLPHSYEGFGEVSCQLLSDYKQGYDFGILGIRLSEKLNNFKCVAHNTMVIEINHWTKPITSSLDLARKGIAYGLEEGEIQFACFNHFGLLNAMAATSMPLDNFLEEVEKALYFVRKHKNVLSEYCFLSIRQFLLNLQGKTIDTSSFDEGDYQEAQFVEKAKEIAMAMAYFYIFKLYALYLFENYEQAQAMIIKAREPSHQVATFLIMVDYNFYHSLTLLALYPKATEAEQHQYHLELQTNQNQMKLWADNCPENFRHKYLLVQAEIARLEGNVLEAMDLYDQAIVSAKENEFLHNEALCNELAAKFWLGQHKEEIAQIYLKKAHYHYQQWGALAKVKDLEQRYPPFLTPKTARAISTRTTILATQITSTSTKSGSEWLDMSSIMKAAQTLSGEIVLSRLLSKMMRIVIENAGASIGFLLLPQKEQWIIEAEGQVDSDEVHVLQSIPLEHQPIAATIIHYVVRTQEHVVLHDASQEGQFIRDPHIVEQHPKSVLCTPLINQGQLTGILYLENNLTTGAFTPTRLEVLKVLSSQLAISIENALLYRTLEQKVEERTAQLAQANTQLAKTNTQLADANQEISTLNEQLKSENLRMSAELDVSRQLQQMLLPKEKELEAVESLDIAGFMEPADEVGGDYYDVLQHKGRILFGIGDVTGHGLESGALAIMVQSSIRTLLANNETEPVKFFSALNEMVFHNVQRMNAEKNLTLALVDYKENQLYVSGQHEEVIVVRNGELELVDTMNLGFPVGLDEDISGFVNQVTVPLNPGDVVVLYTDGITEALNMEKEEYLLDRLCEIIQQNWQQTAHEIREAVISDVRQFIGKQKVFDDITLLVLKQK